MMHSVKTSMVYKYNTERKLDIHVKVQREELKCSKKSVINMGSNYITICQNLKKIKNYKAFKKDLRLFLLLLLLIQTF